MPIFNALGLGMLILVLGWLAPNVLAELEATVIAVLHGARVSAEVATTIAARAGSTSSLPLSAVTFSALPPYPLPQAPTYAP